MLFDIHPLAQSAHLQWHPSKLSIAGIHRHVLNLLDEKGLVISIHRCSHGLSPMGMMVRSVDFTHMVKVLQRPQTLRADQHKIYGDSFTLSCPQRLLDLRVPKLIANPFATELTLPTGITTGLFGPLESINFADLPPLLDNISLNYLHAMQGKAIDWSPFIGMGPGLTPSSDDLLLGMLLASWASPGVDKTKLSHFFSATDSLNRLTPFISASYLYYASKGFFSNLLVHFIHALNQKKPLNFSLEKVIGVGHTSGADMLTGFMLAARLL